MKRGSRKRCRGSGCCVGDAHSPSGDGSGGGFTQISVLGDLETDGSAGIENGGQESGSSRCSVHLINQVVSKFCREKISIVQEMGFEGILKFPDIKQFNRRYAMWLMSNVDPESQTLKIGEEICIKFEKSDVAHVLGTPCNGKAVLDSRFPVREAKERVLDKYLGSRFKENRSIKVVQEIIERDYSGPMSQLEIDTFKVAFIVFVVSTLLAPSAKHDYASIDYWNAIADPGLVHSYDWSEFVVVKLLEGVSKLKDDVASNIKFPIVTGCFIFLQVLYLDSLDFEGHLMRHNTFPRIRDFTYDKIRLMISDDRNFLRHVRGRVDIPYLKLRDPVGCVYAWSLNYLVVRDESRGGPLLAVWEATVAMINLLEIPLEAGGPLFVAAADFQEQVNSGMLVTGTHALKFISVLMSIMICYRRRSRHRHRCFDDAGGSAAGSVEDSIRNGLNWLSEPIRLKRRPECSMSCGQCLNTENCGGVGRSRISPDASESCSDHGVLNGLHQTEIGDDVQRSAKDAVRSLDDMPHYLNLDARVASAISQFYSVIKRLKPSRDFDLNSCACDVNQRCGSSSGGSSSSDHVPLSPWELGYCWSMGEADLIELGLQMECLRDYDGMVVVHRVPKYIQITGIEMYSQAVGNCEMEADLFDVLVRYVRQNDAELYASYGEKRWRYVFESDFMACVLSGSSAIKDMCFSDWLRTGNVSHDLSKCKILFFPAIVHCSWVCFAWAVDENVIYVFEPSQAAPVDDRRVSLLERSCYVLKIAMVSLGSCIFGGDRPNPQNASFRMLTLPGVGIVRMNRSGALCYMFCCCFDGTQLVPRYSSDMDDLMAARIMHCGLRLQENSGKFPDSLIQYRK